MPAAALKVPQMCFVQIQTSLRITSKVSERPHHLVESLLWEIRSSTALRNDCLPKLRFFELKLTLSGWILSPGHCVGMLLNRSYNYVVLNDVIAAWIVFEVNVSVTPEFQGFWSGLLTLVIVRTVALFRNECCQWLNITISFGLLCVCLVSVTAGSSSVHTTFCDQIKVVQLSPTS